MRVALSDEAMGTIFTVELYGHDREALENVARDALAEATRVDRLLSNYKPDSEWSAMNREATRGPFVASAELFDLLAACVTYSRETDGAFDVSVGPLMKVWGFFKDEGALPATDTVARALSSVGSQYIQLDRSRLTVEFRRPDVELDPGGIGKGYAIDRMVDMLMRRRVNAAFLSAGGSSMYAIGAPPDSPNGFAIRIVNPRAPSGIAALLFLKNTSLSTSGSYEKFFRAGGRTYSHIMDPRTGFPAIGSSSVSVIAPRTVDSEAWTKAYFINGRQWAAGHRAKDTRVLMCDDDEAVTCRWIE